MALREEDKINFDTLVHAMQHGFVALVECVDNDGNYIAVVCAVNRDADGNDSFVPLAKLFDMTKFEDGPYDEVHPKMVEREYDA
jgi:hypothetical protein